MYPGIKRSNSFADISTTGYEATGDKVGSGACIVWLHACRVEEEIGEGNMGVDKDIWRDICGERYEEGNEETWMMVQCKTGQIDLALQNHN